MMRRRYTCILFSVLAILLLFLLAGCGGNGDSNTTSVSGTVLTVEGAGQGQGANYVPLADALVYATDPDTGQIVSPQVHTNLQGAYLLPNVPDHGGLMITAEKDQLRLRTYLSEKARKQTRIHNINPDTTIAAEIAQQLRDRDRTRLQIDECSDLCLQYQKQHGFGPGGPPDFTKPADIVQAGKNCLQSTANEHIKLALQNRTSTDCVNAVSVGTCDAAVNMGCQLQLTEQQRDRIAQRACQNISYTSTEASALFNQAGIRLRTGGDITEADLIQARDRLRTRLTAFTATGSSITPIELLLIVCQDNDSQVPFVATQEQYNSLINLMAP